MMTLADLDRLVDAQKSEGVYPAPIELPSAVRRRLTRDAVATLPAGPRSRMARALGLQMSEYRGCPIRVEDD